MKVSELSALAKLKAFAKLQRAKALASRDLSSDALAEFEEYFSLLGDDGQPSTKAAPDINVLYALTALKADREQKAMIACEIAIRQIAAMRGDKLKESDLAYLSILIKYILLNLTGHLGIDAIGLASQIDRQVQEIDVAAISPRLMRMFPIPGELVNEIRDYERKLAQ